MISPTSVFAHRPFRDPRAPHLASPIRILTLTLLAGVSGCAFDKSGLPFNGTGDAAVVPDAGDGATATCGNGSLDQGEDCDGNEFGGQTCVSLGYYDGDLICTGGCLINPVGCSTCGNDEQQGDEHCDGDDLAGATCENLGFDSGNLSCGADCTFDTGQCTGSGCGDGTVDTGELCDSANLNGQSCDTVGMGFTDGVLSCTADCVFNVSACTICGDGLVDPGEACDSTELNGADCGTEGFAGGSLSCDSSCALDTSACTTCGDGQLDTGEECDEGGNNSNVTPDACREDCTNHLCGDGVCDTDEHGSACLADCKVLVFADDFDSTWTNGWATGDNEPVLDLSDTWEPATNAAHSGTKSLWCSGYGYNGINDDTYDNNMQAYAVHAVNLSGAAGMTVYFDLWLWVNISDSDDYFAASFSIDGGNNYTSLEAFNGNTGGWEFHSYDISAGAGNPNVLIGLWFQSDGSSSGTHGAYVDDVEVWYTP
jgi:hypothetical protein